MAGFPLAGTYRTPDGVTANVMEQLGQDWDDWTAHDDTYIVDGENVVVLARYTATNKATGKEINVRVAHHFVVRGGTHRPLRTVRRHRIDSRRNAPTDVRAAPRARFTGGYQPTTPTSLRVSNDNEKSVFCR